VRLLWDEMSRTSRPLPQVGAHWLYSSLKLETDTDTNLAAKPRSQPPHAECNLIYPQYKYFRGSSTESVAWMCGRLTGQVPGDDQNRVEPEAKDEVTIAMVTRQTMSLLSRLHARDRGCSIERNWTCLCEEHLSPSAQFHQSPANRCEPLEGED